MKLSAARFVSIDGTEVTANPRSKDEAKIALKELRQKKKEFQLRRRALLAQAKTAKENADRIEGRPARKTERGLVSTVGRMIRKAKARKPKQELAAIEDDIRTTDEILFNLDSCAVQIEGKLLQS
jgi:hypothetical protein